MGIKNFAKYAGLFLAAIILMTALVNANLTSRAYSAQITAEGSMTLTGLSVKEDVSLNINIRTNFTSLVPENVPQGSYNDVDFHGGAVVYRQTTIKFDGMLTVENINFWVKFAVEKPADENIKDGMYSAVGKLDITISEFIPPPLEIIWVLMKGRITSYGESKAYGGFMAHAKISENDNWTVANGYFTVEPPLTEAVQKNHSRSYYEVNLVNATKTQIDADGNALYVEGYWNVRNRTITVTIVDNTIVTISISIDDIVKRAYGELIVTLNTLAFATPVATQDGLQGTFTLKIDGIEPIGGSVIFFHYRFAKPMERAIPMSDFNKDRVVNIVDIGRMANAYGKIAGMPGFDFDLDLNMDFKINILDLATAATEFGADY